MSGDTPAIAERPLRGGRSAQQSFFGASRAGSAFAPLKWAVAAALAFALASSPAAAEGVRDKGVPGDQTWSYDHEGRMGEVIKEARSYLPTFWTFFDHAGPAQILFSVKAGLPGVRPSGEETVEHIWVGQLRRDGAGQITGVLMNAPNFLGPSFRAGSEVTFDEARISDWMIETDRGNYGAFTVRFMLDDLPPDMAAEQRAILSPEPVPQSWRN